jgi:hypothetical protein
LTISRGFPAAMANAALTSIVSSRPLFTRVPACRTRISVCVAVAALICNLGKDAGAHDLHPGEIGRSRIPTLELGAWRPVNDSSVLAKRCPLRRACCIPSTGALHGPYSR